MSTPAEEIDKPLDAAEITRLIEVARSESYKADSNAPKKDTGPFKPKSLLEMAQAATVKDAVEPASKMPPEDGDQAIVERAEGLGLDPSQGSEPIEDASPEPEQEQPAPEGEIEDWGDADDFEAQSDGQQVDPEPQPAPPPPDPADLGPRPANPEELKEEWGKGFSAGQERARADLQAEFETKLAMLEAAISAFTNGEGTDQVRADIIQSVKDLASERAGSQIDEVPEPFLERVEDLVDRIRVTISRPTLRLNPDDIAALKPYIEFSETLSEVNLVAAPNLGRGDVELSVDGMRYADRLSNNRARSRQQMEKGSAATTEKSAEE